MKKVTAFIFAFFLIANYLCAQSDSLLKWNISLQHISDSLYKVTAHTNIPPGWYVYGKNESVDGLENVQIHLNYENASLKNELAFNKSPETIADAVFDNKKVNIYRDEVAISQLVAIRGEVPPSLTGSISAYLAKEGNFLTAEQNFSLPTGIQPASLSKSSSIKIPSIDIQHPLSSCGQMIEHNSMWTVFFLGFAGGLIALLTPCVFPMIPVTVSFFTKRSGSKKQAVRNGTLYGFFIFLIYVLISVPFHVLGKVDPGIFNTIATNAALNIIFFIIFIIFSLSFFGFFEITLPSSIAGRADSKSSLNSLGGIFFMALTLVIVSFSCTGVILGSLLVGYLTNGAWPLTLGLAGFGLALALPFAVFAIFPGLLKSLPKSGGWLDTVKKVLAFVEVALAFKFLSNADLVMHWGLLRREVFIGIWIIVSLALSLFLFGVIHLPHDEKNKISWVRKFCGVLVLFFTIYLLPGITNTQYARLQLLSGFPPPLNYSIYKNSHKGLEPTVRNDYDKALQLAAQQHKPILIDFTGWACVNCRKMEENVWAQPEVHQYIQDNFILVSLYVDDRAKLPPSERITYRAKDGSEKNIETQGDKWATFEEENFSQASQPLYAIINSRQQLLSNPVGYTPNVREYLTWLQCGKKTFDEAK